MEKFDVFKKKKTSEDLAADISENRMETASAEKEAIERSLIQRMLSRGKTERQMNAADQALNLDAVYDKFKNEIQSEAEYIGAAYKEYSDKLMAVAQAQGIEAPPCPIDTFIQDVEGIEGSIQKGDIGPEYSFYTESQLGRDSHISRQVSSDIAAVIVPAGTKIGFGPGVMPAEIKQSFYRSRPGMERDAAIAEAQAKNAEYILRSTLNYKEQRATALGSAPN